MLSKPGEARKTSTPSQRRRKGAEETPDDVVRRLQRLPTNKACADCTSKLTQCVNLTHGTFVCMACSGVHREFNHKIKGIGHSSFTPDEVARLKHPSSGNEAVNSYFLANHNRSDRMKPPQNNNDLQHLRSWIQSKYIDRVWCEGGRGGGGGGGGTKSPPASRSSKTKSKSETARRNIMPKASNEQPPPKPAAAAPPPAPAPADPFGFDSIASTSSANDASWDAFGGSSQNAAAFQADFGNSNPSATAPPASAPPPAPAAAPVPPAPAASSFQADFGNFSQQPTMVSLPPTGQSVPPVQQQSLQPPASQQQASFQANFDQSPSMAMQAPSGQIQQQHQQVQGFGNFPTMSKPQQPPPNQMQQQGFANFSSVGQQPQQQPQQPQVEGTMGGVVAQQGPGIQNQHQGGGGMNFGQFPQMSLPQMQHQQTQQSEQSGFANFSSIQPEPQPQMHQTQIPSQAPTIQTQNQQPSAGAGMMNSQESSASDTSELPPTETQQPAAAPSSGGLQNENDASAAAATMMNPNAFRSVDSEKKDAFDAFDGLSLEPTPTTYTAATETNAAPAATSTKTATSASYHEGQQVLYSNSQGSSIATIIKVHYDDELHPYYTINVNGREKQTNDSHLSVTVAADSSINDSDSVAALLKETASMLENLNAQQLIQVKEFVSTMLPSPGQNTQANGFHQQSSIHVPAAPMGGAAQPTSQISMQQSNQSLMQNQGMMQQQPNMMLAQNSMQQQQLNQSMMQNQGIMQQQPNMMPAQNSMQQQQLNQSIVQNLQNQGIMQQQPNMMPAQNSMQQQQLNQSMTQNQGMMQLNQGMNQGMVPVQQPMQQLNQGMGMMPGMTAPPPPSTMPPPPPPSVQMDAATMPVSGMPQQTGTSFGVTPPSVAHQPPPIEKEGNPFDHF